MGILPAVAVTSLAAALAVAPVVAPVTAPVTAPAVALVARTSIPAPAGLSATEVSFRGFGGLTLHGTVLAPTASPTARAGAAPRPGVVLVTGSGSGVPRDHLLTEATWFARHGLAVLIYDKRSVGYTLFRRSYSELADDALAAVAALRAQPGVDPTKVGLWGLSEGGWVVPLAASRSPDVAFVILVGANAVPPIRQQLWSETSSLRRAGVSGSLVERGKREFMRLGADAGLFAEAHHDAPAVLRRVRQPVLAVWGSGDVQTPPQDNPPLMARALREGGNRHYTFRFFAGAGHSVHVSPDGGLTWTPDLAPGYAELVGSWVRDVTGGRLPDGGTDADPVPPPRQPYRSVAVPPSAWWESADVQLAAFGLLLTAFGAYPVVALWRRARRRRATGTTRWAGVLAGAGALGTVGPVAYLFALMAGPDPDPGPLLGGRPLPWLVLQVAAVTAVGAGVATAVGWWRAARAATAPGPGPGPGERGRRALLLAGGVLFVPWAAHWGLLLP